MDPFEVVTPPPDLSLFAGPHTLFLSYIGFIGANKKGSRLVLVVTCQAVFITDLDSSSKRIFRITDIDSIVVSERSQDIHPIAKSFFCETLSVLFKVKETYSERRGLERYDVLMVLPRSPPGEKDLFTVLQAVHREHTGRGIPVAVAKGRKLADVASLKQPKGYRLPHTKMEAARGCRCISPDGILTSTLLQQQQQRQHQQHRKADPPQLAFPSVTPELPETAYPPPPLRAPSEFSPETEAPDSGDLLRVPSPHRSSRPSPTSQLHSAPIRTPSFMPRNTTPSPVLTDYPSKSAIDAQQNLQVKYNNAIASHHQETAQLRREVQLLHRRLREMESRSRSGSGAEGSDDDGVVAVREEVKQRLEDQAKCIEQLRRDLDVARREASAAIVSREPITFRVDRVLTPSQPEAPSTSSTTRSTASTTPALPTTKPPPTLHEAVEEAIAGSSRSSTRSGSSSTAPAPHAEGSTKEDEEARCSRSTSISSTDELLASRGVLPMKPISSTASRVSTAIDLAPPPAVRTGYANASTETDPSPPTPARQTSPSRSAAYDPLLSSSFTDRLPSPHLPPPPPIFPTGRSQASLGMADPFLMSLERALGAEMQRFDPRAPFAFPPPPPMPYPGQREIGVGDSWAVLVDRGTDPIPECQGKCMVDQETSTIDIPDTARTRKTGALRDIGVNVDPVPRASKSTSTWAATPLDHLCSRGTQSDTGYKFDKGVSTDLAWPFVGVRDPTITALSPPPGQSGVPPALPLGTKRYRAPDPSVPGVTPPQTTAKTYLSSARGSPFRDPSVPTRGVPRQAVEPPRLTSITPDRPRAPPLEFVPFSTPDGTRDLEAWSARVRPDPEMVPRRKASVAFTDCSSDTTDVEDLINECCSLLQLSPHGAGKRSSPPQQQKAPQRYHSKGAAVFTSRSDPPPGTIWYPAADGRVVEFDRSDKACEGYGVRHGEQMVNPSTKDHFTIIGERDGMLWAHRDGDEGAAPLDVQELCMLRSRG